MPHRAVVPEPAPADPSDSALHEKWLLGLMWNPALPVSVLCRLLAMDRFPGHARQWLEQCKLLPGATEVIAAGTDARHRRAVLENPNADAAALVPLAYDPDPRVRRIYVAIAPDFRRDIPPAALEALAGDEDGAVRAVTAGYRDLPLAIRARLAQDPEPKVRAAALNKDWDLLPAAVRAALLADPAPGVRQAVERATRIDQPLPRTVGLPTVSTGRPPQVPVTRNRACWPLDPGAGPVVSAPPFPISLVSTPDRAWYVSVRSPVTRFAWALRAESEATVTSCSSRSSFCTSR